MLPRPQVTGNGILLSPDGAPASDAFLGASSIALAIVDATGYASVSWAILYKIAGSDAALTSGAGFTNTLTKTGSAPDSIDLRVVATGTDGRSVIHVVHLVVPTAAGHLLLDRTDVSIDEAARAKINPAIAGGGGGSSVPSATGPLQVLISQSGAGFPDERRRITLDDLGPAASTTLTKTSGTALLEIGATLATPAFTSAPSATPSSAIVTDTDGNTAQNVTSTPTGWTSTYSYTKSTNAQSVTWTVTDIIGGVTKTASVTQQWGIRAYYGATSTSNAAIAAMDAATLEAFVEALPSSTLATSRARSLFSTSLTAGQHLVIENPTAWGTPVFKDENGLVITAIAVATGTRTNANGVSIAFTIYDVSAVAVGAATVQVSVS